LLQSTSISAILQTWPTQFAIAAFFTIGFALTYYQLWRRAFITNAGQRRGYLARAELLGSGLILGTLLHWMGLIVPLNSNSMMFHNLGFLIFYFMLLDEHINLGEYLLRCAAIYAALIVQHIGYFDRWQFWISLSTTTILLVVTYVFDRQFRANIKADVTLGGLMALSFWPWLPPLSAGLHVNPTVQFEAVIMFIMMAWVAKRYWNQQDNLADTSENMTEQANYDTLTQLRSYSLYEREVPDMIAEAKADGEPFTTIMFDIDHFKEFNDEFGHPAGDAVLMGVAATVRKTVLQYVDNDLIYRVGGEEFVILLPGMTITQATRIARDCSSAVCAAMFSYEGTELHVTISMGMTALKSTDRDIRSLYKRVDEFLYQSKRAGRDAITIEGHTERRDGNAADTGYRFFAQPIVNVDNDGAHLVAKELLLRMRSVDGSHWELPNTFDINVDVQVALIKQVLENSTCRHLGINLLPSQFTDLRVARTLAEFVRSQEDFTLTLELTGVPNLANVALVASIYHDAGIRISIDNVGSVNHYEAIAPMLSYVDVLKFSLQNLRREHDTENLDDRVKFWQQVAKDAGIMLIISGVETRRDATHFRTRYGIYRQQGFLYGRPSIPND
jgi:diguanylate cyclase (GGDEF)-like protein